MEGAEEADRSRYRLGDEAELAKYLTPLLLGHSGSRGEEAEDLSEGSLAVRRKLQGLPLEIQCPSEDDLSGAPTGVPVAYLLDGSGLVSVDVSGQGAVQHFIDCVKEMVSLGVEATLPPLTELDEIVHEHVRVIHRKVERPVGRRRAVLWFRRQGSDPRHTSQDRQSISKVN